MCYGGGWLGGVEGGAGGAAGEKGEAELLRERAFVAERDFGDRAKDGGAERGEGFGCGQRGGEDGGGGSFGGERYFPSSLTPMIWIHGGREGFGRWRDRS